MAEIKILFKELPFRPSPDQVFYIENGYDANVNDFIRNNYHDLKSMFSRLGLDFYYLPYLLREHNIEAKVRYYAPYLSDKVLATEVRSNAFVPFISDPETGRNITPSFIFGATSYGYTGNVRFTQLPLSNIDLTGPNALDALKRLIWQWQKEYYHELSCASYSMRCANMAIEECACENPCLDDLDYEPRSEKTADELAEERSLIETDKVLRELRMTVQKLRLEGVSLMAIHEFIDKQEPISHMVITPDYRIFLPDYNNMEIEMGALPKAVYFLFLRYPEGIICKHMQDYHTELLNIYKQLRPNTDPARLTLTITKVVNPLGNALNENIARIRKAFVEKFDEHLANNYIITGERGSQYLIPLDRSLITWQE